MGKRKRHNKVNAEGGGSNLIEVKQQTRNKKKSAVSPANKEDFDNVELTAAKSSQKESSGAMAKASKGRNRVDSKAATRQSTGGEWGAKKCFSWSTEQESIALAELAKLTNVDAGQSLCNSSINWEQLTATVGERLEYNLTRTQMYEKVRRLKERYQRMKLLSRGKSAFFKNEDDEKFYKLSQQIWGTLGATQLKEGRDLRSDNVGKKSGDVENLHKDASLPDDVVAENPGVVTMDKETALENHPKDLMSSSEPKEGAAHEQVNLNPDITSQSKIHAVEGDTQKTFEVFHAEHHALLKELEKSYTTVLQDMQGKFLSMMNNIRGSQFPWMGGGVHVPSFNFTMQTPPSWDKLVDNCLSTSTNKPAAFENLYDQWRQQRLQELKLTSMKLQLMVQDCKMEQEKLEKQVLKSN